MKILLVCNAGMSSSILVKKIKEAGEKRGLELTVEAKSSNGVMAEVGKWDVCLVGPQIIYAVETIKATLGIPVQAVEPRVYAMADGDKALDQALKMAQ